MRGVAIIPARGGSKRLPRKNIALLLDRPLLAWPIEAALESRYLGPGAVYVSTEDAEIAAVAGEYGAEVIRRPDELAGDQVWTEPVIRHAVETLERSGRSISLIAWMNASIPEVTGSDIDAVFGRLLEEDLREIVSVDAEGRAHSGVRVLRRDTLFQNRLSVNFAVQRLDYLDIHTAEDLAVVESRMKRRRSDP